VSYWVKAVLGLGLFVAGLAVFERSVYLLMHVGACASAADSAAGTCPPQPIETSLLIPVGLLLLTAGLGLLARGAGHGGIGGSGVSGTAVGGVSLFLVTGVVALVAGLGARGPGADSAKSTGIFLAALFGVMAAAFVYQAVTDASPGRGGRAVAPQPAPAAPSDDPIDALQKLEQLRASGTITQAEFETAKTRILAEL
jgi:hypothetical protein